MAILTDAAAAAPGWWAPIALAGLGAIFGSFLGAAVTRWPRGESVVRGRSHCDGCGAALRWFELVPIASFAVLRGRCRRCGGRIGLVQPATEAAAAGIGVLAALAGQDVLEAGITAVFAWQLLLLALLDSRAFWLPLRLIALLAASAVLLWLESRLSGQPLAPMLLMQAAGAALGFAILSAAGLAYRSLRGREGLGSADPWLLAAIGVWLGPAGTVATLALASGAGLVAAGALALAGRRPAADDVVPLGSLLALAAFACRLIGMTP